MTRKKSNKRFKLFPSKWCPSNFIDLFAVGSFVNEAKTIVLSFYANRKEWKKLRNKYLDMQRKCIRQLRKNARQQHYYEHREYDDEPEKTEVPVAKTDTSSETEFQPGAIIKITLEEPISDAKRFKV